VNFKYLVDDTEIWLRVKKTERIEAVERSLEIVDAIHKLDGARVTELANYLDWAPSTVHSHLKTLEHHRYLVKEGTRTTSGWSS